MRGKDKQFVKNKLVERITPAYAGKSIADFILSAGNWDHPRLCGEKPFTSETGRLYSGSPPPMRGKVGQAYGSKEITRITPAYAGKSVPFRTIL